VPLDLSVRGWLDLFPVRCSGYVVQIQFCFWLLQRILSRVHLPAWFFNVDLWFHSHCRARLLVCLAPICFPAQSCFDLPPTLGLCAGYGSPVLRSGLATNLGLACSGKAAPSDLSFCFPLLFVFYQGPRSLS
jgi:hypothetical protein